jgi:hypothetical protein
MKFFVELFWQLIGTKIETSVALFKIDAAITYLNIIKGTRRMAILFCLMVLFVALFTGGFLLIPVALCLFMPWPPETRVIVAASFGSAYILIPLIVVMALFSQKRWMRTSRADKLLNAALKG